MKYTIILFAALIALVSCTPKQEEPAPALKEEIKPASVFAVILSDTSKWTEKSEGLMAYAAAGSHGEVVEALLVQDGGGSPQTKYDTKRALREKLEGERDFYHVKASDGKDYWVQDLLIAIDAVPCIVTSDAALLYSKPDIGSLNPNTLILPQYAILGLHQTESTEEFACVSGYVTEFKNTPVVAKQFVKTELVSTNSVDIQAMKLYKSALANKNEIAKRELLTNAQSLRSTFAPLIEDALAEMDAPKFTQKQISATMVIITLDGFGIVNVRDKPGLSSNVLFQLEDGHQVSVTAVTNESEMVDDIYDNWYYITSATDEKSGWVFGAYLEGAKGSTD
jgi:hypothetical protein